MTKLQQILTNNKITIEYSNKQNWNGINYIAYENIYLAQEFNKLNSISNIINIISGLHTNEFVDFLNNTSSYINGLPNPIVSALNNQYKDSVYGLCGIIINDIPYIASSSNDGNLNIGNYLTNNLVKSYNGLSGALTGVQKIIINGTTTFTPDENGFVDLGNYLLINDNIVYSINGVKGDIYGITDFKLSGNYIPKDSFIALFDYSLNQFITQNYNNYYLLHTDSIMSGIPTCNTPTNNTNIKQIINLQYLTDKINNESYLLTDTTEFSSKQFIQLTDYTNESDKIPAGSIVYKYQYVNYIFQQFIDIYQYVDSDENVLQKIILPSSVINGITIYDVKKQDGAGICIYSSAPFNGCIKYLKGNEFYTLGWDYSNNRCTGVLSNLGNTTNIHIPKLTPKGDPCEGIHLVYHEGIYNIYLEMNQYNTNYVIFINTSFLQNDNYTKIYVQKPENVVLIFNWTSYIWFLDYDAKVNQNKDVTLQMSDFYNLRYILTTLPNQLYNFFRYDTKKNKYEVYIGEYLHTCEIYLLTYDYFLTYSQKNKHLKHTSINPGLYFLRHTNLGPYSGSLKISDTVCKFDTDTEDTIYDLFWISEEVTSPIVLENTKVVSQILPLLDDGANETKEFELQLGINSYFGDVSYAYNINYLTIQKDFNLSGMFDNSCAFAYILPNMKPSENMVKFDKHNPFYHIYDKFIYFTDGYELYTFCNWNSYETNSNTTNLIYSSVFTINFCTRFQLTKLKSVVFDNFKNFYSYHWNEAMILKDINTIVYFTDKTHPLFSMFSTGYSTRDPINGDKTIREDRDQFKDCPAVNLGRFYKCEIIKDQFQQIQKSNIENTTEKYYTLLEKNTPLNNSYILDGTTYKRDSNGTHKMYIDKEFTGQQINGQYADITGPFYKRTIEIKYYSKQYVEVSSSEVQKASNYMHAKYYTLSTLYSFTNLNTQISDTERINLNKINDEYNYSSFDYTGQDHYYYANNFILSSDETTYYYQELNPNTANTSEIIYHLSATPVLEGDVIDPNKTYYKIKNDCFTLSTEYQKYYVTPYGILNQSKTKLYSYFNINRASPDQFLIEYPNCTEVNEYFSIKNNTGTEYYWWGQFINYETLKIPNGMTDWLTDLWYPSGAIKYIDFPETFTQLNGYICSGPTKQIYLIFRAENMNATLLSRTIPLSVGLQKAFRVACKQSNKNMIKYCQKNHIDVFDLVEWEKSGYVTETSFEMIE